MDPALQNFISRLGNEAREFLDEYGKLTQQNALWAGTPSYQTRITQAMIDAVPSFKGAGLTLQQITDACFAMESMRTTLTNTMPQLTLLANLP